MITYKVTKIQKNWIENILKEDEIDTKGLTEALKTIKNDKLTCLYENSFTLVTSSSF